MKDEGQSPEQYRAGLRQEWQERLGHVIEIEKLHTALSLACAAREARLAATRSRALNAAWGNFSPDMQGKSIDELLDIAQPNEAENERLIRHNIIPTQAA